MSENKDDGLIKHDMEDKRKVERVTAEDMKRKYEKNAARRKTERVERAARRAPAAQLGRVAVTAVAGVVGLGLLALGPLTSAGYEEDLSANAATIAELKQDISDLGNQAETMAEPEVVSNSLDSAVARAREVADLQNAYIDLGDTSGDEVKLAEYGRMTDDGKRFFTNGAISGGQFLPHGKWYTANEPGINSDNKPAWVPMPPGTWRWDAVPLLEVDDDGKIPALWEARMIGGETDGALLATVTGTYDPARNLFSGMKLMLTPDGHARVGATTSPDAYGANPDLAPPPEARELMDQARKAAEAAAKDEESKRKEEAKARQREELSGEQEPPAPAPEPAPGGEPAPAPAQPEPAN